jgi:hypothetical protein
MRNVKARAEFIKWSAYDYMTILRASRSHSIRRALPRSQRPCEVKFAAARFGLARTIRHTDR